MPGVRCSQDVTELWTLLQDALEKTCEGTPQDGFIKALFQGHSNDYIRCLECGYEHVTVVPFVNLNVQIRGRFYPAKPAITNVAEGPFPPPSQRSQRGPVCLCPIFF